MPCMIHHDKPYPCVTCDLEGERYRLVEEYSDFMRDIMERERAANDKLDTVAWLEFIVSLAEWAAERAREVGRAEMRERAALAAGGSVRGGMFVSDVIRALPVTDEAEGEAP